MQAVLIQNVCNQPADHLCTAQNRNNNQHCKLQQVIDTGAVGQTHSAGSKQLPDIVKCMPKGR